jgi:hypothetical protein
MDLIISMIETFCHQQGTNPIEAAGMIGPVAICAMSIKILLS